MEPQNPQASQFSTRPRTIVVDLARLIKQNKISQADLKLIDKNLREEAIAYASILEETIPTTLNIRKHAIHKPGEPVSFGGHNQLRPTPIKKEEPGPILTGTIPSVIAEKKPATPAPAPVPAAPPKHDTQIKIKPVIKTEPPKPATHKIHPQINKSFTTHTPIGTKSIAHTTPPKTTPPNTVVETEASIQSVIQTLASKKTVIEKEINELMSEKNARVHTLEAVKSKEKEIEDEELRIRLELNDASTAASKKSLEEKRWNLEDERQTREKERWDILKSIDALDQKILGKKNELSDLLRVERENREKLDRLQIKKRAEEAREALKNYEASYEKILERKKKYESEWLKIKNDMDSLKTKIENKKGEREDANRQFEETERKERATTDEKQRHALEEERWQADMKLRENAKAVWASEEELERKSEERNALESTFASIQTEEEDILEKIAEAKLIIQKAEAIR
jgi:hypothetical protein